MAEALINLQHLTPEWIVCGTVLFLLVAKILGITDRRRITEFAVIGLGCSLLWLVATFTHAAISEGARIGGGILLVNTFSQFFKILFLISTLAAILFSHGSVELSDRRWVEYCCFVLGLLSGMMFLASSVDLMMVYLSFEMMSITAYILAGYTRGDPRSAEAGYKYVLFGAVSSGFMLFGLSYLYGMTGSMNLEEIGTWVSAGIVPHMHLMFLPLVFILVGVGYKLAFFPFHYWAPDVYEGAPTPVTAFFSVGPKAAGFALFLRILFGSLSYDTLASFDWLAYLLVALSALTMTVGNLAALNQTNVKRMLAYSSIAHVGYMLMGMAVLNGVGARAVVFYLVAYLFTNLAAFTVIIALFNLFQNEQVDEMAGYGRLYPVAGVCMAICLFSLTGLPPTAGFVGKFYIFAAVIEKGFYELAFVGAVNTVLSLFYYTRILKAFYFKAPVESGDEHRCLPCGYSYLIVGLTLPVLYLGICWGDLIEICTMSISSLVVH